jgi:hypothetical protein
MGKVELRMGKAPVIETGGGDGAASGNRGGLMMAAGGASDRMLRQSRGFDGVNAGRLRTTGIRRLPVDAGDRRRQAGLRAFPGIASGSPRLRVMPSAILN